MSRSYKKPILKDKSDSRWYNRTIRRVTKNSFRKSTQEMMNYSPQWLWEADDEITEIEIPSPKNIINDWSYCDWKVDLRDKEMQEFFDINKLKRK